MFSGPKAFKMIYRQAVKGAIYRQSLYCYHATSLNVIEYCLLSLCLLLSVCFPTVSKILPRNYQNGLIWSPAIPRYTCWSQRWTSNWSGRTSCPCVLRPALPNSQCVRRYKKKTYNSQSSSLPFFPLRDKRRHELYKYVKQRWPRGTTTQSQLGQNQSKVEFPMPKKFLQ